MGRYFPSSNNLPSTRVWCEFCVKHGFRVPIYSGEPNAEDSNGISWL